MSKTKRDNLGKGIRALLGDISDEVTDTGGLTTEKVKKVVAGSITNITLTLIEVNPFQPRASFDEDTLNELVNSIKVHGIIQPITVRLVGQNKFQLISGERRLRASKMAGLDEIPAYVRQSDDQEMLEIALIENIQREDLNAIEIAINYKRLMDECKLTQEELSGRIGKNRSTVTNFLRLLKLPPNIQQGIKNKTISMGHARALSGIDDSVLQLVIFKDIVKKQLSVRQVEKIISQLKNTSVEKIHDQNAKKLPLAYQKIQDKLSSLYSTKVKINRFKGERGEIVVSYFTDDDLNRILDQLTDNTQ